MFLRAEPLTLMYLRIFIFTHAVVPSMEDKTSPQARNSPASIQKAGGVNGSWRLQIIGGRSDATTGCGEFCVCKF